MYIFVYIHICICICIRACIYKHIYLYTHINIHTCIYIHVIWHCVHILCTYQTETDLPALERMSRHEDSAAERRHIIIHTYIYIYIYTLMHEYNHIYLHIVHVSHVETDLPSIELNELTQIQHNRAEAYYHSYMYIYIFTHTHSWILIYTLIYHTCVT